MSRKIVISKRIIILFVVLIIYIEPPFFASSQSILWIHKIYDYLKIGMTFVVLAMYYGDLTKKHTRELGLSIVSIWLVPLISALVYHANFKSGIKTLIIVLIPCFVFSHCYEKNKEQAINVFSGYLNILLLINFLSQVIFPNGITKRISLYGNVGGVWFLGVNNSMIAFGMAALVMNLIRYEQNKKKRYIIVSVLIIISVILDRSATASVGTAIFLLTYLFKKSSYIPMDIKKKINANSLAIVAFVTVLCFLVLGNINLFSGIIVGILGKDLTLTTRTGVWEKVKDAIAMRPVFGYGFPYIDLFRKSFGVSHQHDFYLHVLFQGGFCSLFAFCFFLNLARKQLIRDNSMVNQIISAGIFAYLIMFITEVYDESLYILPFYIMVSIPILDSYNLSKNNTSERKQ